MTSPVRVSQRLLALLVLLCSLLLLAGCYERKVFDARKKPASAKVYVNFQTDPQSIQNLEAEMRAAVAQQQQLGVQMGDPETQIATAIQACSNLHTGVQSRIISDLPSKNIGFVVTDPAAPADLKLLGTMRSTGSGEFVVDWQLVEPKGGTILRAGTTEAQSCGWQPNRDMYADQILTDLIQLDLEAYASGAPIVQPTNADNPVTGTPGDNAWAIVVGIENYREKLPAATFAENDATAFAEYIQKSLNVPPTHIKVLLNDRAARADIASAIEEWLPRNAKEAGRVYVFFSGHGAPDTETGDAYLVPYDADPAYLKTRGYPIGKLYEELGKLPNQEVYVFLDACFSGTGDRSVLAEGTRPLVLVKTPAATAGVASFAAATPQQTTGGLKPRQHGMFTAHLLDALRGAADANADGNISLDEISSHVTRRVEEDARLQNREQTPVLTLPAGAAGHQMNIVRSLQK